MLFKGQLLAQPLFSPAADRNKEAILVQLQRVLPAQGTMLEIASGTGQHIAWFAQALPGWSWTPSDAQADGFANLITNTKGAGLRNVQAPRVLDVLSHGWQEALLAEPGGERFDMIYCANMLHIAPWAACAALMQGAAKRLTSGGQLILYGPYFEDGVTPSEGNVAFDAGLRGHHPDWGIRRREDVEQAARGSNLRLQTKVQMPSHNLLLVFGPAPA